MVGITLVVAGCGQGTNAGNGTGSTANSKNNGKSGEAETVLQFWYPGHEETITGPVKELIAGFEQENPTIKIEYTPIPWKDYFQKLTVAYSAGSAPDVHGLGFGQLISTVDQDKYMDLNPFIEKSKWDGKEDYFPDILQAGQWQGGQYGLLMPDIRPLVWRKDFFKEAGLDPETPPQTLDELFTFAEKLKKVETGKTVRAGIDIPSSNGEQAFLSMLMLQGENYYQEDGTPTFDSDASISLLEKMVNLNKNGALISYNGLRLEGSLFQNSEAAMGFTAPYALVNLKKTVGAENIGYSFPPKGSAGKQTALMLGTFLTMSKSTKYGDAAWKFMEYWTKKENLLQISVASGYIPARKSLKEEYVKLAPENQVLFGLMNDARGFTPSSSWAINSKYLRNALEEAYFAAKTPEQAMKDNAQKAKEELKLN
ncbi:multiple sugar transport system substrate-binding protein [Paenibacillus algorifonticola]|uniref:Multiple sugar transport system substrate-binding protein n=2 Tax=Paenibacillus algorifonticola TaxID=684063 RepID=A0A1I2GBB4_9BACL|nr:multiple sugar transport system substrate-binding protein [Paenibacillus algorifonticola]